ncbi:hypothetical protein C4561_03870 [candidate division WWE3 bacterium]|jgi:cell pole-organizing protein PopZ|uniref:Uncharacterized protein n=1 Tax=candidate division WWE3 bacterium TaxID=2053526 RepID=A0A3A4ZK10_UNCKA|nr:MAG: hypothetical protein C4561_03870 [candidate division WWE3 bacterium]
MDNTQNPYMRQFQNQQDNQTGSAPGSLDFVPSTPETPTTASPEKSSAPEKQPAGEKPSLSTGPQPQQPDNTTAPQVTAPPNIKSKTTIVDKTDKITELHHVQHPKDKLTSIADLEEEEFISEVETAHGHK